MYGKNIKTMSNSFGTHNSHSRQPSSKVCVGTNGIQSIFMEILIFEITHHGTAILTEMYPMVPRIFFFMSRTFSFLLVPRYATFHNHRQTSVVSKIKYSDFSSTDNTGNNLAPSGNFMTTFPARFFPTRSLNFTRMP